MHQLAQLDQITLTLTSCLDTLDTLGFAAAAAFVESAITALPSRAGSKSLPEPVQVLKIRDDVDYTELDALADIYFAKLVKNGHLV